MKARGLVFGICSAEPGGEGFGKPDVASKTASPQPPCYSGAGAGTCDGHPTAKDERREERL